MTEQPPTPASRHGEIAAVQVQDSAGRHRHEWVEISSRVKGRLVVAAREGCATCPAEREWHVDGEEPAP